MDYNLQHFGLLMTTQLNHALAVVMGPHHTLLTFVPLAKFVSLLFCASQS